MAEGMQNLRRGLEVKMHTVLNDAARTLADRINRVEPKFNAKPQQTASGPQSVQVTVTGQAELPKDHKDEIVRRLESAIESTFGR